LSPPTNTVFDRTIEHWFIASSSEVSVLPAAPVSNAMWLRDSLWNAAQKISSGQGAMMAQSSGPFFTVFISVLDG